MSSHPFYSASPEEWSARRSIGYLVRRAGSLVTSQLDEAFSGHGLTFVQWAILMLVREGLARTAAELCKDLVHDSGALTRVLDQLEQRGLIMRCRSCQDRRVVELSLTDEGRRTAESLIPLVAEIYNSMLADFTREETETLIRLLGKLTAGPAKPAIVP